MEPQLIDYYNEMPSGINVIDKMNEELDDLQKKYDALEKKVKQLNDTIINYKDNIIFDFFFNHDLDVEKQKELKNTVYSDYDEIFFCKNCNEFVYEENEPFICSDSTKYELYTHCKYVEGRVEQPCCEDCFDDFEHELDNINLDRMFPNTFPPEITTNNDKIKSNIQFFRESIFLHVIKNELKKYKDFDEKYEKMEEFSNKYFNIIIGPQEGKWYRSTIEDYIYEIYIVNDDDENKGTECDSDSNEGSVE